MLVLSVNVMAAPPGFESYREERLPGGPVVWWIERTDLPATFASWVFPAGSRFEPDSLGGLAALTAGALREARLPGSRTTVGEAFDESGASLDVTVDGDAAVFTAAIPASSADSLLILLARAVCHPTISGGSLARSRGLLRAGRAGGAVDAADIAQGALLQRLYAGHPYGHDARGNESSWGAITLERARAFHDEHYRPAGAHLIVVGPLRLDPLLAGLRSISEPGAPAAPKAAGGEGGGAPLAASTRRVLLVDTGDGPVAGVAVGLSTVARRDTASVALELAGVFLGDSPMSLLESRLRSATGLTYNVTARFIPGDEGGVWTAMADVTPGGAVRAVREILATLDDLSMGTTLDDFENARLYWRRRRTVELEDPARMLASLVRNARAGRSPADWRALPERIEELDFISWRGQVRGALNSWRAVIVVAGPAASLKEPLSALGPVEVVTRGY